MDLIILVTYSLVEGLRESITASKQENTEHSSDSKGVSLCGHVISIVLWDFFIHVQVFSQEFKYFIYVCISTERQITLGVLYGYKALLQLLAVILALKTSNVKVKGLDDSLYIIVATYLSSLVLLTVIIMTYTAYDLINTYAVVTSGSFILGSTMIVGLVFIPKVCRYIIIIYTHQVNVHNHLYICTSILIHLQRIDHTSLQASLVWCTDLYVCIYNVEYFVSMCSYAFAYHNCKNVV